MEIATIGIAIIGLIILISSGILWANDIVSDDLGVVGMCIGIISIMFALAFLMINIETKKENNSSEDQNNSQVEMREGYELWIPYNHDGGFLITEDGEYRVYTGAPEKIEDSSKEDSSSEECDNSNSIPDDTRSEDSSRL